MSSFGRLSELSRLMKEKLEYQKKCEEVETQLDAKQNEFLDNRQQLQNERIRLQRKGLCVSSVHSDLIWAAGSSVITDWL